MEILVSVSQTPIAVAGKIVGTYSNTLRLAGPRPVSRFSKGG